MSEDLSDIFGEEQELREELEEVARALRSTRPEPRPAFRAALISRLRSRRLPPPRPRHLRARALALAIAGALLLGVAALGLSGHGPLAPSRTAATPVTRLGR